MLFDTWSGLARVLIVGTLAYVGLVTLLRISGKRTLSKMNAFDLVVTVALGSTLSTILLSKDVALAEGMLALVLLILLQFVVTWSSARSQAIGRAVKSEPALLFLEGHYLHGALRRERITQAEAEAATRQSGFGALGQVFAIILETDGSISVIGKAHRGSDALESVRTGSALEP